MEFYYYGILLIIEKYLLSKVLTKVPRVVKHAVTLVLVIIGWVFFSAPTLGEAFKYLGAMFGAGASFADAQSSYIFGSNVILLIIGIFCATPLYKSIADKFKPESVDRLKIIAFPILLILCIVFMISETYNPFLYFRF